MMREDREPPACEDDHAAPAGAGHGGELSLRAVTGEPFSKDRKMGAPSDDADE